MRILIAEDEQRTRQGLVRVLQSLRDEYEIVAQASNGKAALEMILEQKPDVVFIDIKMPFMDGLSVLMLGFIYTFRAFDLMYIMTAGGPLNSTDVLGTYSYMLSFTQFNFSKGAAVAMVLFACLFLIGLFYLKLLSKEEEEG